MTKTEQYLQEFKNSSNSWFDQQDWFIPRFEFFTKFFTKEFLDKAEWNQDVNIFKINKCHKFPPDNIHRVDY